MGIETQKLIVVCDEDIDRPERRIEVDTGLSVELFENGEVDMEFIRDKFVATYREVLDVASGLVWGFYPFECSACFEKEEDGRIVHSEDCMEGDHQRFDVIDFITGWDSVSSLEDAISSEDTPESIAREIVSSGWSVQGIDLSDEEAAEEAVRKIVEIIFDEQGIPY